SNPKNKEKVTQLDNNVYTSCVEGYCCFYGNGRFHTNFRANSKDIVFLYNQRWSNTIDSFYGSLASVSYFHSGVYEPTEINPHPVSVKASTQCEGGQCTWSCEINSKIEFQFQFQFDNENALNQSQMRTITMQRGGSDRFSCSTRFCCNSEKKVNFNSVNIKNNSLVDWIQSKESIDPTDSPNFILT
ncbi:hypothetical protein HMI56_005593, partial [Coelomomyces lativittatus]